MPRFIRSNLLKDHTSATETIEKDLPTNPISHLIFSLSGQQMTDEATLAEIIAFINTIEVTKKGVTIISAQSEDLFGVNCYLFGKRPHLTNNITTDNATRTLTLMVPFGRKIYDPGECYPKTKKGDLTLRADMTVLGTSIDGGIINIDCVELPDANPRQYLKTTMMEVTAPGKLGDNDVELPIGNKIIALQVRMTTVPTVDNHTYGVNEMRILVDNSEFGYANAKAECLMGERMFKLEGALSTMLLQQLILPEKIVWLDYDPHGDDNWLLETAGKSSVKVRLNMGVDEATYITLLELVNV